ncbi:Sulfotransferase domain protein [Posidoniimonas polymericola]|uniref:Sulfotransferase domain protein n=1 Tax=Posidoniimonas polymericola TaxID=2528002 RepID=A0A5C5YGY3_9BACT|nr:sulfotransferase domain-containing protein [Posidoniimonas polymericola]TWT73745.1 Sulfotransferase domain protein [Posidoniimonas polymericola]
MLQDALHHKNPFVRKAAMKALGLAKRAKPTPRPEDLRRLPPAIANSFPKSGTHLLDQLVGALPGRVNYGEFHSSMTSSFVFRRVPDEKTAACMARNRPGEIVRAHLFYSRPASNALRSVNAAHYYIYRDPRDVVVSEAHYLRDMNRWHRLHQVFKQTATIEDAIRLAITGVGAEHPDFEYPNIGARFGQCAGWLSDPDCCAVRFEDLTGPGVEAELLRMAQHYAARSSDPVDPAALAAAMKDAAAPEKSHTYRSGKRGGWRNSFTPELRALFDEVAGPLLIELGYEADRQWVQSTE